MRYFKHMNPASGAADFWAAFRQPTPYRWPILLLSVLISLGVIYAVTQEKYYAEPEQPKITYITTFEPGRSDAEIMQSNLENQQRQKELEKLRQERIERRKAIYRALGRATGLDVDAMERQIAEDEAREKAQQQAAQDEAALKQNLRDQAGESGDNAPAKAPQ